MLPFELVTDYLDSAGLSMQVRSCSFEGGLSSDRANELRALLIEERGTPDRDSLTVARVPDRDLETISVLQGIGFRFVDMSLLLDARLGEFTAVPSGEHSVREVSAQELERLAPLASSQFTKNRLRNDVRIPVQNVQTRFERWILESLSNEDMTPLLVSSRISPDPVAIFIIRRTSESAVNWDLTTVLPKWQGMGLSQDIWATVMSWQKSLGVSLLTTRISANNLPLHKTYVRLGFEYRSAEVLLHHFVPARRSR